jgi:hypothetical protein
LPQGPDDVCDLAPNQVEHVKKTWGVLQSFDLDGKDYCTDETKIHVHLLNGLGESQADDWCAVYRHDVGVEFGFDQEGP